MIFSVYWMSTEDWTTQPSGGLPCWRMHVPFLHCIKSTNKHHRVKITSKQIIVQYNNLLLAVRESQPMSMLAIIRKYPRWGIIHMHFSLDWRDMFSKNCLESKFLYNFPIFYHKIWCVLLIKVLALSHNKIIFKNAATH